MQGFNGDKRVSLERDPLFSNVVFRGKRIESRNASVNDRIVEDMKKSFKLNNLDS